MEHFQRIASNIDVGPLTRILAAAPNLFREIIARQNYAGSAHKDTETIFLRWCAGQTVEAAFNEIEAIEYPAYQFLEQARPLVLFALNKIEAEELGRVIIAKLRPGGAITPHSDEGPYSDHFERFHLALESDTGNAFMIGDDSTGCGEFVHMRPGELWWFNHKMTHWVANASERPRTHLIIDAVAPKFRRERV